MAKIIKKKFYEIELPLIGDKYETYLTDINDIVGKTVKVDITRKLRGKSVDLHFQVKMENGKAVGVPKKLVLMPFFIKHMLHTGIDYVEDSIEAESRESKIIIKPFLITRKKVSRAVRRTLRNSAKNWIVDYLKTKMNNELFEEILNNQLQKPLSLKLKKVYPLAICEIRMLEVKKPLANPNLEVKVEAAKEVEELTQAEELELAEAKKAKKSKKSEEKAD